MFSLLNKTKYPTPKIPFEEIKNSVLGQAYELSLVFVLEKESHALNLQYRQKDKPTNILSFPLDKETGEIFICLPYAKKEAPSFEREFTNYIAFLFIHGLIHLKGLDHGSIMEAEEEKIRKLFAI